jgi:hypothetical protein
MTARPLVALALTACAGKAGELATMGDEHPLRAQAPRVRPSSPERPPVMLVAFDGLSRGLLYEMLRAGELPNLAQLVGGDEFVHAHFDDSLLSTLPSTTMAAWVTTMTGVGPAEHGVTGNEFFIRETRTFACPAPVSFDASEPTLEIYTDGYLDALTDSPTVYEYIRKKDPDVLIWVAMNHIYRGADKLLLPKRTVIAKALAGFVQLALGGEKAAPRDVYAALDTGTIDTVVEHLKSGPLPDVLTLYIYGTDLWAHVAPEGPRSRRAYMRDVVDPALAPLVEQLRLRGQLDRLWTIVISDHGHTEVPYDHAHALGGASAGPPRVLRDAGFRVREFKRAVPPNDPFSAVLAYGGALAYVYLADRSQCPGPEDACAWGRPPRYIEDVIAAAEAFHQANERGPMRGQLDMILVREPRPVDDIDLPFEVYVGGGHTMPVDAYLREHPHPTYVAMDRLRDLAVGVHGERAGDILLVAQNGDVARPESRYYFASPFHSWHGSPSREDSEIPLIVANRHHNRAQIGAWVHKLLGKKPYQQKVTDIVIGLREGALGD